MPTMGRYCKAYPLGALRRFEKWSEASENASTEERDVGAGRVLTPRTLVDDSYVFLHETLAVTDSVFLDENVLFSQQSAEWEAFCRNDLAFIPPSERVSSE